MGEIPVRVLNQETAKVLARVKQGEEIEITERGVVVARLLPAEPSPLGRLLATGNVRMPRITGRMPHPRGELRTDQQSGELLEAMRDEERY
jgi:prevent-host-death family protein